MKRHILTLVLVAVLTSFTGNAKAAIIFQNLDQTILAGQTFNFGFDGSTITTGSGGYSVKFTASQFYPAQTFNWTYEGIDYSYTYPEFTSSPSMSFETPGYPNYINMGGNQGGGGKAAVEGNNVKGYDLGWSNGPQVQYSDLQNSAIWVIMNPYNGGYAGWAQLSYNNNNGVIGAVAFATGSGDINIGDTGTGMYIPVVLQNVAVPEPSALSLLALGLGGLVILRRRPLS
jgi:PEP-CTERM motif